MSVRTARAVWEGRPDRGQGIVVLGSEAFEAPSSRFREGGETSPEELLGRTTRHGRPRTECRVETTATVRLESAADVVRVAQVQLAADTDVPGIDEQEFCRCVEAAARHSAISETLRNANTSLDARLHCRAVSAPAYHSEPWFGE